MQKALASAGFVGTWRWEIKKGLLFLDRLMADVLMNDASLAGKPLDTSTTAAHMHPDDRSWLTKQVVEALKDGRRIEGEYRVRRPDGTTRRIRSHGAVYKDIAGIPLGVRGISLDITPTATQPGSTTSSVEPLTTAIDHLLAARDLLAGEETTRHLLDMVLLETARTIASQGESSYRQKLL